MQSRTTSGTGPETLDPSGIHASGFHEEAQHLRLSGPRVSTGARAWLCIAVPVVGVAYYPAALMLIFGIWPPSAMVYEVLGANYFPLPFLRLGAFFVETGFGSHVLLSFPAYVAASLVAEPRDGYHHLFAFGLAYHLIVGLMLALVYACCYRATRNLVGVLLLMLVPLAPSLLEPETNLNLMLNYGRAQEIVATACGGLILSRWRSPDPGGATQVWLAGAILAIAIAVKFSNVLVFGPLILLSVLLSGGSPRSVLRRLLTTGAISLGVFCAIIFAYNQFSLERTLGWATRLIEFFFRDVGFQQHTPFLFGELARVEIGAFYLPLEILLCALVLLGCWGLPWQRVARGTGEWRRAILLRLGLACIGVFLVFMLWKRPAQGTMIDISISSMLGVALLAATFEGPSVRAARAAGACVAALVVGTAVFSVRPAARIDAMSENSAAARELDALVRGEMPVVYYLAGWAQPLLFPSADLLCQNKAGASQDPAHVLAHFCPGTQVRDPGAGLVPTPHVAVIPEFREALPMTPLLEREWPDYWRPQLVDEPQLDPTGRLRGRCKTFHFREVQAMAQTLLYYSAYSMSVRACPLR